MLPMASPLAESRLVKCACHIFPAMSAHVELPRSTADISSLSTAGSIAYHILTAADFIVLFVRLIRGDTELRRHFVGTVSRAQSYRPYASRFRVSRTTTSVQS